MKACEIFIKCISIDSPLELANLIAEQSVEMGLSEATCEHGVNISTDLELYPFFGEEEDEKYTFEHAGLKCSIKRSHLFCWLGYVEYEHECSYDDIDVEVHGGLTYGDGEELGFDCCHFGDLMPKEFLHKAKFMQSNGVDTGESESYKDYNFVVEETKKLAEQLAAL